MQMKFFSVMVKDQEAALRFYTNVLGFVKTAGLAGMGGRFRPDYADSNRPLSEIVRNNNLEEVLP
jgi:hypothetical protein